MLPPLRLQRRAFSLIELVIVIAIIVIIAAFTIPVLNTALRGSQLSQASTLLVGQISLARQQAMTRNHAVEVRFYRFGDPEIPGEKKDDPTTGQFRAVQMFEVQENGAMLPIEKPQMLPNTVVFAYSQSQGLSSLLDKAYRLVDPVTPAKATGTMSQTGTAAGTQADANAPALPRGIGLNYQYIAFRFLQDGSTNLKPTSIWYVTLISNTDHLQAPDKPPANFFTVQIDPVSGATRNYRPTAG